VARHARIRLLLIASVLAIATVVWVAGERQRAASDHSFRQVDATGSMMRASLARARAFSEYVGTGQRYFQRQIDQSERAFAIAAYDARAHADRAEERRSVTQQQVAFARFGAIAEPYIGAASAGHPKPVRAAVARRLDAAQARLESINDALKRDLLTERHRNQRQAGVVTVALIILLCAAFGLVGYLLFERRARRDGHRRDRHSRFAEVLQLARTESEAYQVVKRHLEGLLPDAKATVLNRNNSANRLEASTDVGENGLREALDGAEPESCIAVRGGRTYRRHGAGDELMSCEVCGAVKGDVTCMPSLVGGEVIGSVLVEHAGELSAEDATYMTTSIGEAAPVIANLRNLAIAEVRAATDGLTGLPNKRSVQETLKRMTAQSGRAGSCLAAVLFDLDHFKHVNDTHGHGKGDETLAMVSEVAAGTVRASDFVGRYGGEEFIVLLPDTDRSGAVQIAEKLREAIAAITIPGLDRTITASFGVAVLPDEAVEPEELVRVADRALYTAKSLGRNRVEVVAASSTNGSAPSPAVSLT
jgi:diguanylate cyclase (GGDEF)-like protein